MSRGQEAAPAAALTPAAQGAALTPDEFHAMLEARLRAAGGVRRLALELGISSATVSRVIRLRVAPCPTLYLAMGYRKIITYEPRPGPLCGPRKPPNDLCATSRDANDTGP